jgi:CheY-like chemotaxis protein
VKVVVTDTGEGMSEATRRRIFEPFFTTKESGNGMGLAAVYGAVESHRGDISLQSELGRGTSFTMLLPLSDSPRESVTLKVVSPYRQFPGTRILLAEDEGDVAQATTLLLEEMGCIVTHLQDGQAALDAFREAPEQFDMEILDHMMPRLSGREALIEMRKVRPSIRALLTSGYATETVIEHTDHPEAFLPKPFNQVQLGISLARVLESPQEASTAK